MAEERSRDTSLGARGQAGQAPRGGFSREVRTPRPSLTNAYDRSTDTVSPALELATQIGADTYVGVQSKKIEQSAKDAQHFARLENTGRLGQQEAEQLERTNRTFRRYANARRQGAMTDAAANIAVESEMRRVSNQFPALGGDVRRSAAQTMGFDPTGSEWSFLTQPPKGQEPTPLDKDIAQARQFAMYTGSDPEEAVGMVLKNYQLGQEAQMLEYQSKSRSLSSADTMNAINIHATRDIMQTRRTIAESLINSGVTDIASLPDSDRRMFISQMRSKKLQMQQQARQAMMGSGMSAADMDARISNIGQQYDTAIENLDTFSTTEVINATIQQRQAMTNAYMMNKMPEMTMARAIDPQNPTQALEVLLNSQSPAYKKLQENNPFLQTIDDRFNQGAGAARTLGAIWSNNENLLPERLSTQERQKLGKEGAAIALNNEGMSNTTVNGNRRAGYNALSLADGLGAAEFTLNQIASNPAKYANNQGAVDWLKDMTGDVFLNRVASRIRRDSGGGDLRFEVRNGRIAVQGTDAESSTEALSYGIGSGLSSVSANGPQGNLNDYSAESYVRQLNMLGDTLDNSRMSSAIGATKEQLVDRLNKQMSNPATSTRRQPSNNVQMTPVSTQEVSAAAESAGLDPTLYSNVIRRESNFGQSQPFSSAGAGGPAQFMPDTARDMGLRVDDQVDERFDNDKALVAGAKYLKQQIDAFDGDQVLGLMAYNWGPGNVERMLSERNPNPSIPQETLDYVESITGMHAMTYLRDEALGYLPNY